MGRRADWAVVALPFGAPLNGASRLSVRGMVCASLPARPVMRMLPAPLPLNLPERVTGRPAKRSGRAEGKTPVALHAAPVDREVGEGGVADAFEEGVHNGL